MRCPCCAAPGTHGIRISNVSLAPGRSRALRLVRREPGPIASRRSKSAAHRLRPIAVWLVFVPVAALIYNAFTEDTSFGLSLLSFENFAEAYSGWHIARLLRNSLIFAARAPS